MPLHPFDNSLHHTHSPPSRANRTASIPLLGQLHVIADETLSGANAGAPNAYRTWTFNGTTNITYCLFPVGGVAPFPMSTVRTQLRTQSHDCYTVPLAGRQTGPAVVSPFTNGVDVQCYSAAAGMPGTLVRGRGVFVLLLSLSCCASRESGRIQRKTRNLSALCVDIL